MKQTNFITRFGCSLAGLLFSHGSRNCSCLFPAGFSQPMRKTGRPVVQKAEANSERKNGMQNAKSNELVEIQLRRGTGKGWEIFSCRCHGSASWSFLLPYSRETVLRLRTPEHEMTGNQAMEFIVQRERHMSKSASQTPQKAKYLHRMEDGTNLCRLSFEMAPLSQMTGSKFQECLDI